MKPFFLYVAYSVPHYPLDEPSHWLDMYEESIANESRRLYAASVSHMDEGIGRILTTLGINEIEENTIVLFFSDNGAQQSWHSKTQYNGKFKGNDVLGDNTPLRDWKTSFYDGALRVPGVIMWKGKLSHGKVSEAINVADIYPTLAGLAGIDMPADLKFDGVDLWPALEGKPISEERIMYWRMKSGMALKKGEWKLVHHGKTPDEGTDELYHISLDPNEKENVAAENEQLLLELKKEM